MKTDRSKLGRRKFLKIGSVVLVSPLFMKAHSLGSLFVARTVNAASRSLAAYNRAVDRMVEETRKRMNKAGGWGKSGRGSATVTAEALIDNASSSVKYNPFWIDERYAAGTRWGGLIAFPMYSVGTTNVTTNESKTPECGYERQLWPGENWEFLRPIRVGDTLRTWNRAPQIREQTVPDRGDTRGFLLMECNCDLVNQKDEIVGIYENYTVRIFFPDGPPGASYTLERYGFTENEIVYLDRLARQEKVRGAEIRYWEDVNINDMLDPVVIGPTNIADIYAFGGGIGLSMGAGFRGSDSAGEQQPLHQLLEKEGVIGSEYMEYDGSYYKGAGRHADDLSAREEGEPAAFLWGAMSLRSQLCCLTNWMGDDAFVRKFSWRHITRTVVGDASYSLGKVVNKRIENGEYLVDIALWQQDMRGFIADAAFATVALLSKTQPYPEVKRDVSY
jgi:acyl dehydratase